jgi:hypothetical protein
MKESMKPHRIHRCPRSLARVLGALLLCVAACAPLIAQTHKVAAPENVVRAVGVYEWTGDMAKPAASRLIPVSLFIDGKLEDADVYLARPVPFALDTGNVYETRPGRRLRWARSTWPSRATWSPATQPPPSTTTAGLATASSSLQLRPSPRP